MFWRKPPPPPEPIYKRKPIATAAVMLTIIGMFVLGPVGAIYNGMTEELKNKADNDTVILLIKQIKENDDRQWKEIDRNREQREVISAPKNLEITSQDQVKKPKSILTPEQFEKYINMKPEIQTKYKKYLESRGYDTGGL